MFPSKLKTMSVAVVAAVLLGLGVAADARPRRNAPVPAPKAGQTGRILIWLDEKPQLIKPDGTELPSPDPIPNAHIGVGRGYAQLSPDGTRMAFESAPDGAGPPER